VKHQLQNWDRLGAGVHNGNVAHPCCLLEKRCQLGIICQLDHQRPHELARKAKYRAARNEGRGDREGCVLNPHELLGPPDDTNPKQREVGDGDVIVGAKQSCTQFQFLGGVLLCTTTTHDNRNRDVQRGRRCCGTVQLV
jgi:hypothetical protein